MTDDITDQDIETAREFIAHIRKYRTVTGPNAATAARVLEALLPQPATLADELRSFHAEMFPHNDDCDGREWLLDLITRAEQVEAERDEARADLRRICQERDENE